MKRVLMVCGLFVLMMGIYIGTVGSTYSVRTQYGRIGVYALWDWHGSMPTDSVKLYNYCNKFCLADTIGFSSLYPISLHWQNECTPEGFDEPTRDSIQNDNGLFIEERLIDIDKVLSRIDSMGYLDCFIAGTWPRKAGTYDSSYGGANCSDSLRFYWYFRTLVEMYDGDGIPAYDPLYNYDSGIAYPERINTITGEPLVIKYWEICHEPGWNAQWWPAELVKFDTFAEFIDTIVTRSGIDKFQIYCIAASKGIHDANLDAKVIGPNVHATQTDPTDTINHKSAWRIVPYYDPNKIDTNCAIMPVYEYMSPYSFWDSMLIIRDSLHYPTGEKLFDYFDIISIKVHADIRANDFKEVDSMIDYCTSLGYSIDKPIWLHSIAWTDSKRSDSTRLAIKESILWWLGNFINQDVVEKVHIFTLKHTVYQSLWDSSYNHVLDSLRVFIKRNTPYIRLVQPDSNTCLFSGDSLLILFDSVYDTNTVAGSPNNVSYYATTLTNIKVRIEYSPDDGKNWYMIADSVGVGNQLKTTDDIGNGQYPWSVPFALTNQGKIRVFAYDNQQMFGVSTGGTFTIRTPLWTLEDLIHPLEWVDTIRIDGFDEVDFIYEDTTDQYILGMKHSGAPEYNPGAGLIRYSDSIGFYDLKRFQNNQISWINCIIKREGYNQLILVGEKDANDQRVVKVVSSFTGFTDVCSSNPGPGEICSVVKEIGGNGYIVAGWNDTLGDSRCWIKRFTIGGGGGPGGGTQSITFDPLFAKSFDSSLVLGRFYSMIKTDSCYVAVGHFNNAYGGVSICKFNANGTLLDSASFSYGDSGWACAYGVAEIPSDSGFVLVGRREGWKGGLVIRVDNSLDLVWTKLFYDSLPPIDSLTLYSLNSVIINKEGDIIASGCGYNSLANTDTSYVNHDIGLLLRLDPDNGDILSVTAPLSGLYSEHWKRSCLRPMIKTTDDGFITGCWLYNDSTYKKVIAICKLGYNSSEQLSTASSGSLLGISNYSVLLANSLFRDHSTIRFILPRQSHVRINVYNILGQRVRTLADDERQPGAYEIIWDGRDNHGTHVSSGSYFLRFEAGEFRTTKSLTVIR